MPRFKQTVPIDDYVLDVLMRDLIGHDQQPAAYLVYLYLYSQATRKKWKPIVASLRMLADATGLTPVHVNRVLQALQREGLIERDRRMIRFPSWERMRDVADFNPRYLHTADLS